MHSDVDVILYSQRSIKRLTQSCGMQTKAVLSTFEEIQVDNACLKISTPKVDLCSRVKLSPTPAHLMISP